jgi:hypothetical protein
MKKLLLTLLMLPTLPALGAAASAKSEIIPKVLMHGAIVHACVLQHNKLPIRVIGLGEQHLGFTDKETYSQSAAIGKHLLFTQKQPAHVIVELGDTSPSDIRPLALLPQLLRKQTLHSYDVGDIRPKTILNLTASTQVLQVALKRAAQQFASLGSLQEIIQYPPMQKTLKDMLADAPKTDLLETECKAFLEKAQSLQTDASQANFLLTAQQDLKKVTAFLNNPLFTDVVLLQTFLKDVDHLAGTTGDLAFALSIKKAIQAKHPYIICLLGAGHTKVLPKWLSEDCDFTCLYQTPSTHAFLAPEEITKILDFKTDLAAAMSQISISDKTTATPAATSTPSELDAKSTAANQKTAQHDCARPGCANKGSKHCGRCKITYYCSPKCQSTHWPTHKPTCKDPAASTATAAAV